MKLINVKRPVVRTLKVTVSFNALLQSPTTGIFFKRFCIVFLVIVQGRIKVYEYMYNDFMKRMYLYIRRRTTSYERRPGYYQHYASDYLSFKISYVF